MKEENNILSNIMHTNNGIKDKKNNGYLFNIRNSSNKIE